MHFYLVLTMLVGLRSKNCYEKETLSFKVD